MKSLFRVVCLVTCAALSGCASGGSEVAVPARRTPAVAPVSTVVPSAADYVARATSLDLFVLRSSELALQRASSAKVRDFGRSAISIHEGTSAQLAFASRRLGLATSPVLQPTERQMLEQLEASAQFDRTYVAQQKQLHRRALQLHQAYAAGGASPTLKPVASFVVTRLRDHQGLVDAL